MWKLGFFENGRDANGSMNMYGTCGISLFEGAANEPSCLHAGPACFFIELIIIRLVYKS